jgi:hypothetical protein
MQRRLFIASMGATIALPAAAHHGWSSFDDTRPLYVEGRAATVKWSNPHVELMLDLPDQSVLPADLAQRNVPAQSAAVDAKGVLGKTKLPTRKDKRWEVELAPLARMDAWKIPEIKSGQPLAVIGYTFKEEKGSPILRAEYLWTEDKVYALRSSPVS